MYMYMYIFTPVTYCVVLNAIVQDQEQVRRDAGGVGVSVAGEAALLGFAGEHLRHYRSHCRCRTQEGQGLRAQGSQK